MTNTLNKLQKEIYQYATEWRIGNYVIAERYNKDFDIYHHGHPYPSATTEPVYGIHPVFRGREDMSDYYSKSARCFIILNIPSGRSDKDIIDTSFTLGEAVAIVRQLALDAPDPTEIQRKITL